MKKIAILLAFLLLAYSAGAETLMGNPLMVKNGFVVTPSYYDEMSELYEACKESNQPIFVTTDSILHTSHIFFDYVLRILEIEKLYDAAEELTDKMIEISLMQYDEAENDMIKKGVRLNVAFFSVAKKIFDPDYKVHSSVNDLVKRELENIEKHEGIKERPLLSYVSNPDLYITPYAFEDYSQYVPRGHYTRNKKFKRYFKAMMWYGRLEFRLKPGKDKKAARSGRYMTAQAIFMTDALMRDEEALKLWKMVYEPSTYFVGKTDDLSPLDYFELIEEIYAEGTIDRFNSKILLSMFIDKAMRLKGPRIVSNFAFTDDGDPSVSTKGFRFMGQRFIPDSYMFQELVYGKERLIYVGKEQPFTMENIPNVGPARAFPRGLDVLAVLGSQRALEILEEEGDTDYEFYYEQLDKLRAEFSQLSEDEWKQNLYFRWLYSLLPLLEKKEGKKYPAFMLSEAWLDKEIQAALGSWAELRHDTILYAKQSYTMGTESAPAEPRLTRGYVEPYPEVYGRIMEMMGDLRKNLAELGIDMPKVADQIIKFEDLLGSLRSIASKELAGNALSEKEYALIWNIGAALADIKEFPPKIMEKIASREVDDKMDIIADVHTEPNTSQVLEVGVGQPFSIYVKIKDKFGERLCRGAVFSYYEFKHPMNDRLTDEKWQEMRGDKRPPQAEWVKSFTAK